MTAQRVGQPVKSAWIRCATSRQLLSLAPIALAFMLKRPTISWLHIQTGETTSLPSAERWRDRADRQELFDASLSLHCTLRRRSWKRKNIGWNCVEKLKIKEESGCPIEEEVSFVASHFYGIDSTKLRLLKAGTIESIVSHGRLCLHSEEDLLEFLLSLGKKYSFLYRYIESRFLSMEGIEGFLEAINDTVITQQL
jgi:hypothetical protein